MFVLVVARLEWKFLMIFNWTKTERVDLGVDIYESSTGERVEVPRNRAYDAGIAAARETLRKMHEKDLAELHAAS